VLLGVLDTLTRKAAVVTYPRGGSEYGGFPGLVQPEPHKIEDSATEMLTLAYQTDPAEASDGVEQAADRIRRQARADRTKQHGR
jgi:hypothetical protein